MSNQISEILLALKEPGFPAKSNDDVMRFAQQDLFFHLAVQKNNRAKGLQAYFTHNPVNQIYMGNVLSGFAYKRSGTIVSCLSSDFFTATDDVELQAKCKQLEGCVVVLTNSDFGRNDRALYGEIFTRCDKTIFVVWDWDNHHWIDNSVHAAAYSDLYVPAHHENLYLLTRYNWCTAGPVYAGTIQWARPFLADQVAHIANAQRSDSPLGMHVPYPAFSFRNSVVSTLNQRYSTVGFSTHSFHSRSMQDRFDEWVAHKVHWIIPVLNDVPIRIFDALISGGIPIVPESLRFLPPINRISREHILFYTPDDIVSPERIVAQAINMFDKGGIDKVIERHRYALNTHHAAGKVDEILGITIEKFGLEFE